MVAVGVLCWLDEVLGDSMFYASRSVTAVPPHMTLFDEVWQMQILYQIPTHALDCADASTATAARAGRAAATVQPGLPDRGAGRGACIAWM